MEHEAAESEHQQGEAYERVPVGGKGHRVVVVEDAEHDLGEMIGGE